MWGCDKSPAPLRAIIPGSHVKTCQHGSAGSFLEGQKYRSQVTKGLLWSWKVAEQVGCFAVEKVNFIFLFFFCSQRWKRSICATDDGCTKVHVSLLLHYLVGCSVYGRKLLDIINWGGGPFYFLGVYLVTIMLGCHLWFPSKLRKVCLKNSSP